MLEEQALIDSVLAITGRDLTFPSYTIPPVLPATEGTVVPARYIKADTGFLTTDVIDNMSNTILGAEYQAFNFYTSSKLCKDNLIVEGDLFNISDTTYTYNFKVANDPISQTDGWARFPANYINKVSV